MFCALMRAWRLVPSPEMRTANRRGDVVVALGSSMSLGIILASQQWAFIREYAYLFNRDLRALYLC